MQKENAIVIKEMQSEINRQLADPATLNSLMTITFNGLKPETAKRAMLEAMMRGYNFRDFLEKNVYAIPYGEKYSLISSIDYCRKIGMRSGVCGKTAPEFEEKDGEIISCTITIKKIIKDVIGEFSSTAYFKEYNTGRNLWVSKPRTMLAKVAEMQALRMACPEELAKAYIEEEMPERVVIKGSLEKSQKEENKAKLEYLKELLKGAGKTQTAFLKFLKKEKLEELTVEELDEWTTKLEKEQKPISPKDQMIEDMNIAEEGEVVYEPVPEKPVRNAAKEGVAEAMKKLSNFKKQ